jgi:superfamily II DNA or RNA helicase
MNQGLYEELVTKLINYKINELDKNTFQVKKTTIDKAEASKMLSQHIATVIKYALENLPKEKEIDLIENQIKVSNKIIQFLKEELNNEDFEDDLIDTEGKILKAVFTKIDSHFTDLDLHLKEITPYTRLIHSELFTGGNSGTTLESELRKEILSSDKIDLLVSFIKWKGIRILERELREFTERGGKLRVITTTYIGATDSKAVEFLASLKNTEVKVSYNTGNERLHAKAYLFQRNTGFHTGYIGSSNFSRSALTDGLEWNLKITTKEVGHIIDKFKKTFESYWQNKEFELYDQSVHSVKLVDALKQGKFSKEYTFTTSYFDIKPFHYQSEILEKLEVERSVHDRYKNLLVAATGTGKTVISAFDYKNFKNKNQSSRLLFVAHRKEILEQARATFRGIVKNNNFGDLWVDGIEPNSNEYVFASVQTLNNRLKEIKLSPEYYDFVIIDEVHHIEAKTYRPIIDYFKPKILLGLTATPERMDGADILKDFCNRIAAEIRLPEALNKKLLSPFQYFGITDSIDLNNVKWEKGKYLASELTSLYTKNNVRVGQIIDNLKKYTNDINDVQAIGFCVTVQHATFMTEKFNLAGLKAEYLTSKNSSERNRIREQFKKKEFNYLFVVDIFNEGVDIPEIDTVLFLRPTESLTVFLQQLGRGLRLAEGKECLTVLDFVGNARPEYDFENKFRALIGKTTSSVYKEIEDDFPHLPLGCSIVLEKKAKEIILENIKKATSLNVNQLINKIRNFQHQTTLPLTLVNFMELNHVSIEMIYSKKETWSRLCQKAGVIENFDNNNEKQIYSTISNKWLSTNSTSYFNFILKIAKLNFNINIDDFEKNGKTMLLMLHYDVWQNAGGYKSLEESIRAIGKNKILVDEIIEVLEILIDKVDFKEIEVQLPYSQPLRLHARYTRDQILVAFGLSTFERKSPSREGVAENVELNTELLFINLIKSEENFSPTTMYDDYAISETLFHWQSQNSSRPNIGKGLSYVRHQENGKKILLFIREKAKDEKGNTMGYVFIGEANFKENEGEKPMNIKWELNEPIPNYLWKESAKMSIG